jgi:hypothetical protein
MEASRFFVAVAHLILAAREARFRISEQAPGAHGAPRPPAESLAVTPSAGVCTNVAHM